MFILKGVRDLNQAKWSEYADKYQDTLEEFKSNEESYKEMTEEYQKMVSEGEKILDDQETVPQTLTLNLLENSVGLRKKLIELQNRCKENQEAQIRILKKLLNLADKGGISGFSTLSQIEATKNIAMAAVLIAFSSVLSAINESFPTSAIFRI